MKHMIAAFVAVLALAVSAPAQEKKGTEAPNVTGTWNMGLQGGHVVPVALTLEQKGTTVTGAILLPTQRGDRLEVQLKGELVDLALTLSGTVEGAAEPTTIEITGTLNDDGSMEGRLKGPHGEVPWTAERLKERKK